MDRSPTSVPRDGLPRIWTGNVGAWRISVAIFVLTAGLVVLLKPLLDGEVSSGMLFMLGITLVGAQSGLAPALVAAVFASAIFNFFLADPILTFRMSRGEDLAPPAIFTACAVISGLLAGRLKDKTFLLRQTNLQLESLLDASRLLQAAPDLPAIRAALSSTVPPHLGLELLVFEAGDTSVQAGLREQRNELEALAAAAVAAQEIAQAGETWAYPLVGGPSCAGAIVVQGATDANVDPAFLQALASLTGLALERTHFASVIADAEAASRAEELKSALLSSVSHDLRTPLTAISASASSLLEYGKRLDDHTSRALLQGIVDECNRLNRFTANLLELSRLQSGSVIGVSIPGQVLSVADVMRSAVQSVRARFSDRDIRILPLAEDILVTADSALFELAVTNVIQNALLYSEPDTSVVIRCERDTAGVSLVVTDRGCGIPASDLPRVFDRFYRVKRSESSPQGSGLGLAIAKGFVEAFGGSIEIESPVQDGQGTSVTIRLPVLDEVTA